jgi:hydroxyacylglutathione hydrolase
MSVMTAMLKVISALSDNYIYLLVWGNMAVAVDPGEAAPVLSELKRQNLELQAIIVTHHHFDHTAGVEELVDACGCPVIGPEDDRVPRLTQIAEEGEILSFGPLNLRVFSVPGHTSTHVAFYEPDQKWLLCGDALFGAGCGRLFEGTPEEMHKSLAKLCELPDDTQILCGHEYTVKNLEFASSIEPDNQKVRERLGHARSLRKKSEPTVPSTLAEEKATNPFLRAHDPDLKKALNMSDSSDLEVFTKVRQMRDRY